MCRASCSLTLWLLTMITIATGLAFIITGTVGNTWWEYEDTMKETKVGLWETCMKTKSSGDKVCENRGDLLEFKDATVRTIPGNNHKTPEKDAILMVMFVSASCGLCAFLSIWMMLCCQEHLDQWRCGNLMTTLFTFISAIAGVAGMLFAEVEFNDDWDIGDHGWASIIAWIGSGLLTMAFIFSFILICISGRDFPVEERNPSNRYGASNGMSRRGATNKGYEMS